MNTKRIIKPKHYSAVGIIIIYMLILNGCRTPEWETETTTIYRNPTGNAKMTWQLSNIKSDRGISEEDLEKDYQTLMYFVNEESWENSSAEINPNYIKIWINEDGFIDGLIEIEGLEQKIFGEAKLIVKENTIVKIFKNCANFEKHYKTNGEKIINGKDLIIQWPIETRILHWSKNNPYAKDTVDKLADLFNKRNPKGFVEKHFD
jgi:hypothetical protein